MKALSVQFLKSVSIRDEKIYFDPKQEVVFIGRSNVGKSSLLNAIFVKKGLVHTSSLPGKTRTANIFVVNNKHYFTDMPGYGFAKLGKEKREELDSLISWYLEERKGAIKNVVMILDSKIGAQKTDLDMYNYIVELGIPLIIVLSKVDRLGHNDKKLSEKHAEEIFFGQKICLISSEKGDGVDDLRKYLIERLEEKPKKMS